MALNQVGLERLNTATTKKIGTSKNLIINGAQSIAQRGTSSTSNGFATVDRFLIFYDNTDEAPTQSQGTVASDVTPYTLGFRKTYKIQNGNQTSGAGADDALIILYRVEAQDLASSGWNYTSASSNVTFSFWVKSSVAQNFFFTLKTGDGTPQKFAMETGSLTADTWTKVTKTIPGNSNLQFDNDNGEGLEIEWSLFRGTNATGSMSLNAWAANNNSVRTPDQTSTWYTTNDATFEITGVQLEVGTVATDFEHRSFAEELALCQRYFYKIVGQDSDMAAFGFNYSSSEHYFNIEFPVPMRDYPTYTGSSTDARIFANNIGQDFQLSAMTIVGNMTSSNPKRVALLADQGGASAGEGGLLSLQNQEGFLSFSAEL